MNHYTLKQFDTPLLRFSVKENTASPVLQITWINEKKRHLLPLEMEQTAEGLAYYLKHRVIPSNRAYVHEFLAKCGLHINRPMDIISVSKGLSLNDCYWVTEEGFDGSFEEYNLYENRFSNILALIAFTGYGSRVRSSLMSSPEFTTNGMLPKCWRHVGGKVYLYKGGTEGASNTGCEPYSEFYAKQVADAMGIDAVPYGLSKWKGVLCSTCEIFTSQRYSYLPVGRYLTSGGMAAVDADYRKRGKKFVKALGDMLVLDALICNTDRHYGNFGYLVDTRKNEIVAPAPLFDHGNSLFNFYGKYDLDSPEKFAEYADTLMPAAYDDYFGMAGKYLTAEHRSGLRAMTTFRFKKHSRYNLPDIRLRRIEEQIRLRAQKLLQL